MDSAENLSEYEKYRAFINSKINVSSQFSIGMDSTKNYNSMSPTPENKQSNGKRPKRRYQLVKHHLVPKTKDEKKKII